MGLERFVMKTTKRIRRDARRLFRLCLVDGLLDEDRARQVVQRVGAAQRRSRLALLAHLRRLVEMDRARHTAIVESAAPLPPELQADVLAGLSRMYGPGLSSSFGLRPTLIGGMRIQVGSDVYDASVRAKLAAMEAGF
jgi:F-type H+-transporting ATPase subunit delta